MHIDLLFRHLSGDTSSDEAFAVRRWLDAAPDNVATLAVLRQALDADDAIEPSDADAVWGRLAAEIERDATPIALVKERERREMPGRRWALPAARRSWLPIAAAAAVVAGIALWKGRPSSTSASSGTAVAARVVSTRSGERLSLHLVDGTLVVLAPGSTLRQAEGYGARDRVVHLDGEAAFTVTHDAARPFVVRTVRADARDLGTRFVVRAYASDSTADVIVAEGKVQVTAPPSETTPLDVSSGTPLLNPAPVVGRASVPAQAPLTIIAGQLVHISANATLTVRSNVDLDGYFAWADGRLVFRDTPLRDAATQLSRWYDIDVRFSPGSLGALPLTASFREHTAADALDLVAATLDLKLVRNGHTFTLTQ